MSAQDVCDVSEVIIVGGLAPSPPGLFRGNEAEFVAAGSGDAGDPVLEGKQGL